MYWPPPRGTCKVTSPAGILLINKPRFFSSHDVVEIARRYLNVRKIGHAGTLDPLAEGLLILLVGAATRSTEEFMRADKEYLATFFLGAATASHDADSEVEAVNKNYSLNKFQVSAALQKFIGEIDQIPPYHSAVHFQGERLYRLARAGLTPEVPGRRVRIDRIKIISFKKIGGYYRLTCRISCGKGVFIRSLVRDLGAALGCGAFLFHLQRSRIGRFSLNKSWTMEKFIKLARQGKYHKILIDHENIKIS